MKFKWSPPPIQIILCLPKNKQVWLFWSSSVFDLQPLFRLFTTTRRQPAGRRVGRSTQASYPWRSGLSGVELYNEQLYFVYLHPQWIQDKTFVSRHSGWQLIQSAGQYASIGAQMTHQTSPSPVLKPVWQWKSSAFRSDNFLFGLGGHWKWQICSFGEK